MKDRLPEHIEPLRLARSQRLLQGRLPLARMPRLAASIEDDAGEIDVQLKFGVDVTGVAWMEGHLDGNLPLCCQRCMQQLLMPIDITFKLAIVESEAEIELLGEEYEPLLLDDSLVSVVKLVEDELLLALPIVPRHETAQCNPGSRDEKIVEPVPESEPEPKKNPFEVLAGLKSK